MWKRCPHKHLHVAPCALEGHQALAERHIAPSRLCGKGAARGAVDVGAAQSIGVPHVAYVERLGMRTVRDYGLKITGHAALGTLAGRPGKIAVRLDPAAARRTGPPPGLRKALSAPSSVKPLLLATSSPELAHLCCSASSISSPCVVVPTLFQNSCYTNSGEGRRGTPNRAPPRPRSARLGMPECRGPAFRHAMACSCRAGASLPCGLACHINMRSCRYGTYSIISHHAHTPGHGKPDPCLPTPPPPLARPPAGSTPAARAEPLLEQIGGCCLPFQPARPRCFGLQPAPRHVPQQSYHGAMPQAPARPPLRVRLSARAVSLLLLTHEEPC